MSFPLFREIQSPTAVELSAWARLLPSTSSSSAPSSSSSTTHHHHQLIVARQTVLDIYTINEACLVPSEGDTPAAADNDTAIASSSSSSSSASERGSSSSTSSISSSTTQRAQLQLLVSFPLAGTVASMEVVRLTGTAAAAVSRHSDVDVLLLSFKDAKVSLVGLDPFSFRLKTLAMLNFEDGALGAGTGAHQSSSKREYLQSSGIASTACLRLDPNGRCAALMPYDNQLAIMPFRRLVEGMDDDDDDDEENEDDAKDVSEDGKNIGDGKGEQMISADIVGAGSKVHAGLPGDATHHEQDEAARVAAAQEKLTKTIFRRPYILDMHTLGANVASGGYAGRVTDMAFLHGYSLEPTLCMLIERGLTTSTKLSSLAHTFSLAVVSMDTAQQQASVVWHRDGLPHDVFAVIPVPLPLGGVLVLSTNAIQYFTQYKYTGLALNAFAAHTVDVKGKYKLETNITFEKSAPKICLKLDGAKWTIITPDQILLTERDGRLHLLRLHHTNGSIGNSGNSSSSSSNAMDFTDGGGDLFFEDDLNITGSGSGEVKHLTLHPVGIILPPSVHVSFLRATGYANSVLGEALYARQAMMMTLHKMKKKQEQQEKENIDSSLMTEEETTLATTTSTSTSLKDDDDTHEQQKKHWTFGLMFHASRVADSVLSLIGIRQDAGGDNSSTSTAAFSSKQQHHAQKSAGAGVALHSSGAGAGDEDEILYGAAEGEEISAKRPRTGDDDGTEKNDASATKTHAVTVGASVTPEVVTAIPAEEDEDALLYGGGGGAGEELEKVTSGATRTADVTIPQSNQADAHGNDDPTSSGRNISAVASTNSLLISAGTCAVFPIDSLVNLGPVTDSAIGRSSRLMGQQTSSSSGEGDGDEDDGYDTSEEPPIAPPPTEMVMATGGSDCVGALTVVHRALRPAIINELRLAGCEGLWSIRFGQFLASAPTATAGGTTGLIIISTSGMIHGGGGRTYLTRVFAISDGLRELDASETGCSLSGRTLASGIVHTKGQEALVQVIDAGILLLSASGECSLLQKVSLHSADSATTEMTDASTSTSTSSLSSSSSSSISLLAPLGVTIISAVVRDPFILLRLSDGSLRIVTYTGSIGSGNGGSSHQLQVAAPDLDTSIDPFVSVSMMQDTSGVFTKAMKCFPASISSTSTSTARSLSRGDHTQQMYIFGVRRSGDLEVFSWPTLQVVFAAEGIHLGPALLTPVVPHVSPSSSSSPPTASFPSIHRQTTAGAVQASELCEEDDASLQWGTSSTAQQRMRIRRRLPRTYISDISIDFLPQLTLTMLTNRGQLFAYNFLPGLPRSTHEVSSSATTAHTHQENTSSSSSSSSLVTMTGASTIVVPRKGSHYYNSNKKSHNHPSSTRGASIRITPSGDNQQPWEIADTGRVLDFDVPLQFARAEAPRFIRISHAAQGTTNILDPESVAFSENNSNNSSNNMKNTAFALESSHKVFKHSKLIPFANVSGWSGVAVLSPVPVWLLSVRGTAAIVNMGIPDVNGAGGSSALPGDHTFDAGIVTAFTSLHASFCEHGFVYAHQGHLQFARLPRPQWPTARTLLLVASNDETDTTVMRGEAIPRAIALHHCVVSEGVGADHRPHPTEKGLTLPTKEAVFVALGSRSTVSTSPPQEKVQLLASSSTISSSSSLLSNLLCITDELPPEGDASPAHPFHSITSSSSSSSTTTTVHVVPGPAYVPFFRHALRSTPYHITYLEATSNQYGVKTLMEAMRKKTEAAAAAGEPAPLPATSTQMQCCVQPLYAVAIATTRPRDYAADKAWLKADLDRKGGEHAQIDYGAHVEFSTIPLPMKGSSGSGTTGGASLSLPSSADGVSSSSDGTSSSTTISSVSMEKIAADFNAAGLVAPPTPDKSSTLALMYGSGQDPGSGWVVADTFVLHADERILSIREIPLADASGSHPEPAILVGTGYVTHRGEDYESKGRVMVFRIANALTHHHPSTNSSSGGANMKKAVVTTVPKLKLVYEEEMGCVTALAPLTVKEMWVPYDAAAAAASAAMNGGNNPNNNNGYRGGQQQHHHQQQQQQQGGGGGTSTSSASTTPSGRLVRHVVIGTPRRLQIHEWRNEKLRMIGFTSAQSWIKDIVTMHNYVVYGDIHTSVRFFRWRDEDHQLLPIAVDSHRIPVSAAGLIVHESALGIVVGDAEGNIQVMNYAPLESRSRLVVRGDIHIGSPTDRFVRSRLAFPLGTPMSNRRIMGSFFGTYAGGIGAIQPVDEMTFKRLFTLQRLLTYVLPHPAGLNPKTWRDFQCTSAPGRPRTRNLLDGPLLWRYLGLTTHTQIAFAESIGSTVERVMANLRQIDAMGAVF